MLGIVIVSYKSDDRTVRFVREEISRIVLPYQVVIVANGATEEEADALAARLPEAVVIPAENRGFAAGNNLGVKYLMDNVGPECILLANNDIHFSEGVVETLVRTLDAHPEAAAVGPEVLGKDGRRQGPYPYLGLWDRFVWMYLSTPFLPKKRKAERFGLSYPEKAADGPHYTLSGCFLLVDPSAYAAVGGMDEETFLYAEENILSDRFREQGKCFWFDPSVSAVHEHGATVDVHFDGRQRSLMQFDAMAYYYRKYRHCSRLSTRVARMLYAMILRIK